MKGSFLLHLVPLLLAATVMSLAQEKPPKGGPPKPFTLPTVEEFTLPNGLRVVLVPYGIIPKLVVELDIKCGNMNETERTQGLSDFVSDALKGGTKSRTSKQLAESFQAIGGSLGTFARYNSSAIAADALSEFAEQLVALIADVAMNPTFPEEEVKIARDNYVQNLKIQKSTPQTQAALKFYAVLFGKDHPYSRPSADEGVVAGYTRADVEKFYREHYVPNDSFLFVVGTFDAAKVRSAVRKSFESWKKGKVDEIKFPPLPSYDNRKVYLVNRPGAVQSTLMVGNLVPNIKSPDYLPMVVANSILGGSFNSRITANIREQKGYTYSPFSTINSYVGTAMFYEQADVRTDVTTPSLVEIFKEFDRMHSEPVTDEELQGAKNFLLGLFPISMQTSGGLLNRLRDVHLYDLPKDYLAQYVPTIEKVTKKDVQAMADKHFYSKNAVVVVVGDEEKVKKDLGTIGEVVQ